MGWGREDERALRENRCKEALDHSMPEYIVSKRDAYGICLFSSLGFSLFFRQPYWPNRFVAQQPSARQFKILFITSKIKPIFCVDDGVCVSIYIKTIQFCQHFTKVLQVFFTQIVLCFAYSDLKENYLLQLKRKAETFACNIYWTKKNVCLLKRH